MTIQISEQLLYKNQLYLMHARPLETYFTLGGYRVPFLTRTTMCWRGYTGTWALDGGKLRLVGLQGYIAEEPLREIAKSAFAHRIDTEDRSMCREATIDAVFPGQQGPIFAHWYSGSIEAVNSEDRSVKLFADFKRGVSANIKIVASGDRDI